MTIKLRSISSEAFRNVGTRNSRPLLSFALFILVVGAFALFDVYGVKAILTESRVFLSSGASITTMDSAGEISGDSCDGLRSLAGVSGAGAIGEAQSIRFLALPSSAVPAKRVTPGFLALLSHRSDTARAGVYLSSDLAETLSVDVGDEAQTGVGPVAVEGIYQYPDDGRVPGLAWAALVIEPATAQFDACWVNVEDANSPAADYLLTAVGENPANPPTLAQLNTTLGATFDAKKEFVGRPSLIVVAASGAFGLILGYGAIRSRRLELASALHIGVPKAGLMVQVLLEEALWLVPANAAVLAAVAWASKPVLGSDVLSVFLCGVWITAIGSAAVFIGAVLAICLTRERDLFKYFKDR